MIQQLQSLLTLTFVVSSMLGMGMALTPRQVVAPLRRVRVVVLALVASFVIVPAAALLLSMIPADPQFKIGILLIGAGAGAPFLLKLGDVPLAVGLLVLLVLGTAVYLPLTLPLVAGEVQVDGLAIFTSDNAGERFSDTYPLMGKKMDLLEGGIRVPVILRWPARVRAGQTTDRLAMGMDWMPTFLAAAGVSPHPDYPLDGIDLFGDEVERTVFWRMLYRNQKAARRGDWKYLSIDGAEFLYDLSRDERERANMRFREPEKLKERAPPTSSGTPACPRSPRTRRTSSSTTTTPWPARRDDTHYRDITITDWPINTD